MAWSQVQREQLEKLLQSQAVNSSSAPVIPGTSVGNEQWFQNKYLPWNWKQQNSGFSRPPQGKGEYSDSGGKLLSDDPTKILATPTTGYVSDFSHAPSSVDTQTGPTTVIQLPDGTARRVPTNQIPKDATVMPELSTDGTGEGTSGKKNPNERWTVDDMIKIIDKSAESQKGIISDLLKQQFGYGSAKKLRDTIIDAPLIEAELMAMQADREVENLKAIPKLKINPNMRPDNFNYTQLIHGGRA